MPECKYGLCNGSGLRDFEKADGTIIHNTFCDCHIDAQEPPQYRLKPEDFDFPMSYGYYRGLCHLHGWQDPGDNEPSQGESSYEVILRNEDIHPNQLRIEQLKPELKWTRKQWDVVRQLQGEIKFLENKLNEQAKKKVTEPGVLGW